MNKYDIKFLEQRARGHRKLANKIDAFGWAVVLFWFAGAGLVGYAVYLTPGDPAISDHFIVFALIVIALRSLYTMTTPSKIREKAKKYERRVL